MKSLIAAALLLALASPAHAVTETCIGRVTKVVTVDGCVLEDPALRKRVLRICPVGSWCRIVGSYGGDAVIESIDSVMQVPAPQPATVKKLQQLYKQCQVGPWPDDPDNSAWQICKTSQVMQQRLEARGYCFHNHVATGLISMVRCRKASSPAHAEWFLLFDTWYCDAHGCDYSRPPEDFIHRDSYATQKQCLAAGRRLVSDKTIAPRVIAEQESDAIGKISPRCVASAAELTATPAQWKDIRTLQIAFFRCGGATDDPELKQACDLSSRLQDKLAKQGFCTYKHILVGRLAWHGPEEDRVYSGSEGEKHCYALHEPTP